MEHRFDTPKEDNKNIETAVAVLQSVVYKIDNTVAEIAKSSSEITKLLVVHDSRINYLEKDTVDINKELKDLYSKMENNTKEILKEMGDVEIRIESKIEKSSDQSATQHKALSNKVDELSNRLSELEKWRWYIAGALILITFLISNIDNISSVLTLINTN